MTNAATISVTDAYKRLKAAGFVLLPGNRWRLPSSDYEVSQPEMDLVRRLISTGDCEGFETDAMREGAAAFHANVSVKDNPYSHEFCGGRPRLHWTWGWEIEWRIFEAS